PRPRPDLHSFPTRRSSDLDMVGGGPFHLKPGEWTDDTSMALCLAESLVTKHDFDPIHQLETYVRWWRDGHLSVKGHCFDIGNATDRKSTRLNSSHLGISYA